MNALYRGEWINSIHCFLQVPGSRKLMGSHQSKKIHSMGLFDTRSWSEKNTAGFIKQMICTVGAIKIQWGTVRCWNPADNLPSRLLWVQINKAWLTIDYRHLVDIPAEAIILQRQHPSRADRSAMGWRSFSVTPASLGLPHLPLPVEHCSCQTRKQ